MSWLEPGSSPPHNRHAQNFAGPDRQLNFRDGFYRHAAAYIIGNGLLVMIYLFTVLPVGSLYYPWFVWPGLVWGLGLTAHFIRAFVLENWVACYRRRPTRPEAPPVNLREQPGPSPSPADPE